MPRAIYFLRWESLMINLLFVTCVVLTTVVVGAGKLQAAPFVISNDVNNGISSGSSYFGPNTGSFDGRGLVGDGGFDAFDGYGYYSTGLGGLTLNRRVEALTSINTYRWLDTFTNNTAGTVTTTVQFYGDLGSDGSEQVAYSDAFLKVSRDNNPNPTSSDPILSLVNGNNAWAATNMAASIPVNLYRLDISLSLAPGQSVGILHFALLTRPNNLGGGYDVNTTGALTAAITGGQQLVNDPYLTGFSGAEIASIVNFNAQAAPEPASLTLFGLSAFGLAGYARKRRHV